MGVAVLAGTRKGLFVLTSDETPGVEGRGAAPHRWEVFPRCATRGRARAPLQLPVRDLLFDERETLRPLGNVCVNRAQVDGVDGTVEADDEIRLVAAVAGG